MSNRLHIGNLLSGLAGEGLGDSISEFCTACSQGDKVAIAAVLGGLTGGPLLAVGVLAGGVGLQLWGERRLRQQQREQFADLAERARACKDDTQQLIEMLTPIAERSGFVQARLPGYEKAKLAQWVAKEVKKTLAPLLPDDAKPINWDVLRIYVESNKAILDDLRAIAAETSQGVRDVKAGQKTTHELLAEALERLERLESRPRVLSSGDHAPPRLEPLGPEDRAILDAAKPFADALTRYRIAIAEGNEAAAAELEDDVLRLRDAQRTEEDFLFERARGDRHLAAGRYERAAEAYRMADAARGDDSTVLNDLAFALYHTSTSANHDSVMREVERLLGRALEIRLREHQGDHENVALSLSNLAFVCSDLGQLDQAEQLYERSLAMRQRLAGDEDAGAAEAMCNLAAVRYSQGNAEAAKPLYEQALQIHRRLHAQDHINIARNLSGLGLVQLWLKCPSKAEPLLRESLAMRRRLSNGDDADIAIGLMNMAVACLALQQPRKAQKLCEEAIVMNRRLYPNGHPVLVTNLVNLAGAIEEQGLASDAEPHLVEALALQRRLYKDENAALGGCQNNLGMNLEKQGRLHEAVEYVEQAVETGRRCLPPDHQWLLGWEANLAAIREQLAQ